MRKKAAMGEDFMFEKRIQIKNLVWGSGSSYFTNISCDLAKPNGEDANQERGCLLNFKLPIQKEIENLLGHQSSQDSSRNHDRWLYAMETTIIYFVKIREASR